MNPLLVKILAQAAIKFIAPRIIEGAQRAIKKRRVNQPEAPTWRQAKQRAMLKEERKFKQRGQIRLRKRLNRNEQADTRRP